MKSNASDFLELAELVYIDATAKCTADVSDNRDLLTIRSRVKDEGISFLTITLPQFCSDLERALQTGFVDSTYFLRWKRSKNAVMPAFLQGITSRIFDFETGKVINYEDPPDKSGDLSCDIPTLIDSVRQICLTFKKVELACTPEREQAAYDNFVSIEQSFDEFSLSDEEHAVFLRVSSVLWGNMVVDFSASKTTPKHGPGATAERISGNQKFAWRRWHDRIEPYFPLVGCGYPLGIPSDSVELENVSIVPEDCEDPVRVVAVPKTLKGPRIIAIEPSCNQFAQQGIRDYLYSSLESYWLTKGHINFSDQSENQRLAKSSSLTGLLATIDLSDASDRVPRSLALEMFRSSPELMGAIEACRSTKAQLPDGRIVGPLRKFASMGSALCFPIEAMYFYTICVVALLEQLNLPVSYANVFHVTRMVYVYGDDIIVPSTHAVAVLDRLRKYNCKVNSNKTFLTGRFRESCGMDAYAGYEVTPTYLRKCIPKDGQQASNIISCVATASLFYKKGYWKTAQYLYNCVERHVGVLPYVQDGAGALGRISYLGFHIHENMKNVRWNGDLQRLEMRALVSSPVLRTDRLEGYAALSKCLLDLDARPMEETPLTDVPPDRWSSGLTSFSRSSSLEHSAQHGAVALKRRWVSPT